MAACVLFDLFGTLVEYAADRRDMAYPGTHAHCEAFGLGLSHEQFLDEWDAAFASCEAQAAVDHREFLMVDVAGAFAQRLEVNLTQDQKATIIDSFMEEWGRPITLVQGVNGLLKRLGEHHRMGLISNTHHADYVRDLLARLQLEQHFELILLSADFGRSKPAPEIFRHALESMDTPAENTIYVGDSYEHDYVGATGAGMSCYLIGQHARVPRKYQLASILDLVLSPSILQDSRSS